MYYYEKNIRNPKYSYFVLKNELVKPLHSIEVGYMATHRAERVSMAHKEFTNNAYK